MGQGLGGCYGARVWVVLGLAGRGLWEEWRGHVCPRVRDRRKECQWERETLLRAPGPLQREPASPSEHSMALVVWLRPPPQGHCGASAPYPQISQPRGQGQA